MTSDPRVDAYIDRQQPFAQPILRHLRAAVHAACPEAAETIKWSMPFFDYRGRPLCMMAGFKAHATFGFWRSEAGPNDADRATAMGQFGRLTKIADLPDDAALAALIRDAMALNDAGPPPPRKRAVPRPPRDMPADLTEVLAANDEAAAAWDRFSPSQQRDYVEWLEEAKRPETRDRRRAQAIGQIAEGKSRNWKYERC